MALNKSASSLPLCVGLLVVASLAFAQTRINLRSQSQHVDFSGLQVTKPFTTGNDLPVTCSVGQIFFKTDAPAGANLYLCTTANVWTAAETQGASTGGAQGITASIAVSGKDLVIGACSGMSCNYSIGGVIVQQNGGASIRLNSGSGIVLGYLQQSSGLVVAPSTGLDVSCTGCTIVNNVTDFPPDSIPQFRWTAASGQWEVNGADLRSLFHKDAIIAGDGISIVRDGSLTTISSTNTGTGTGSSVTVVPDASAVGNEIAVFDGADGQRLKRATGTGFVRIDSGVLSAAAVHASDIDAADKQGDGAKLATSGTVVSGNCAQWDADGKLVSAGAPCVTAAGDVSGPGTSSTGEIAVYASATGKTLGRFSGSGVARVNNGVLSAGTVQVSEIDAAGKQGDGAKLATSGTVVSGNCAQWDANGTLVSAGAPCVTAAGDVSGPSTSSTGEIAVYASATGKTLGRFSGTGVARVNNGVLSAGTVQVGDIDVAGKQGDGAKLATSGTVVSGNCAQWDANGKLVSAGAPCVTAAGDVSGPSTSSTGEIAVYASGTGKTLGRFNGNGMARLNNGVLSAGTVQVGDIDVAGKQGDGTKLATSGTVVAGQCAQWDANGKLVSAGAPCGGSGSTHDRPAEYKQVNLGHGVPLSTSATIAAANASQRKMVGYSPVPWQVTTMTAFVGTSATTTCTLGIGTEDGATILAQGTGSTASVGVYQPFTVTMTGGPVTIPAGPFSFMWGCLDYSSFSFMGIVGASSNPWTSTNGSFVRQGNLQLDSTTGAFNQGGTYTPGTYGAPLLIAR